MPVPKYKYAVKKSGYVDLDGRTVDAIVYYTTKYEESAVGRLKEVVQRFKKTHDADWFGIVKYEYLKIHPNCSFWDSVDDYGESSRLKRLYEFKEQYPHLKID